MPDTTEQLNQAVAALQAIHEAGRMVDELGNPRVAWMVEISRITLERLGQLPDRMPVEIQCPKCQYVATIYHVEWSALMCQGCHRDIEGTEWKFLEVANPF